MWSGMRNMFFNRVLWITAKHTSDAVLLTSHQSNMSMACNLCAVVRDTSPVDVACMPGRYQHFRANDSQHIHNSPCNSNNLGADFALKTGIMPMKAYFLVTTWSSAQGCYARWLPFCIWVGTQPASAHAWSWDIK